MLRKGIGWNGAADYCNSFTFLGFLYDFEKASKITLYGFLSTEGDLLDNVLFKGVKVKEAEYISMSHFLFFFFFFLLWV